MVSLYDFGGVRGRRGSKAINFSSLLADESANLRQTQDGETVGMPEEEPAPTPPTLDGGAGGTGSGFADGDGTGGGGGGGEADESNGPAVGVNGDPSAVASGQPGTGGLGGLLGAVATVAAPAVAQGLSQVATGRSIGQHVMNAVNSVTGGGNSADSAQSTGVAPGSSEAEAQGLGIGTNDTGQNTTGAGTASADSAASAAANAAAAAEAAGVATSDTGQATGGVGVGGGGDGGGGGGGGDGTVICTELHRQGYMTDEVYLADAEFGKTLSPAVIAGYHLWAKPYVCLMQRKDRVGRATTALARALALPWAQEMAFRMGVGERGHWLGTALLICGVPVCGTIGFLFGKENDHAFA